VSYRGCRPSGFTLTELLVTLAVVAVVLSAGIPGVHQFVADNRRSAQTNYLLTAFERARAEARRTTRVVSVCPSRNGRSCASGHSGWHGGFIVFANADADNIAAVNAGDEILEVYEPVGGSFTLRASRPVQDFVAFRPTGDAVRGGEFAWCDSRGPREGRAVIVRPSGKALVSKTSASGQPLSCTP
jgi:type IV fimbrial biogenesis protein FimT